MKYKHTTEKWVGGHIMLLPTLLILTLMLPLEGCGNGFNVSFSKEPQKVNNDNTTVSIFEKELTNNGVEDVTNQMQTPSSDAITLYTQQEVLPPQAEILSLAQGYEVGANHSSDKDEYSPVEAKSSNDAVNKHEQAGSLSVQQQDSKANNSTTQKYLLQKRRHTIRQKTTPKYNELLVEESKILDRIYKTQQGYEIKFYKVGDKLRANIKVIRTGKNLDLPVASTSVKGVELILNQLAYVYKYGASTTNLILVASPYQDNGYGYIGGVLGGSNTGNKKGNTQEQKKQQSNLGKKDAKGKGKAEEEEEEEMLVTAPLASEKKKRERDRMPTFVSPNPTETKRQKGKQESQKRQSKPRKLSFAIDPEDVIDQGPTTVEGLKNNPDKLPLLEEKAHLDNSLELQHLLGDYYLSNFYDYIRRHEHTPTREDNQDLDQAIIWYKMAADQGYQPAQIKLSELRRNDHYTNPSLELMQAYHQAIQKAGCDDKDFETKANQTSGRLILSNLIAMDLNPTKGPTQAKWGGPLASPETNSKIYETLYEPLVYKRYEDGVMSIDPSGDGPDETAYVVMKRYKNYYFIIALGGMAGKYTKKEDNPQATVGNSPQVIEKLVSVALANKVNYIHIEKNNDNSFANLLEGHLKKIGSEIKVIKFQQSTNKENKIQDIIGPLLDNKYLIIDKKALKDDFSSILQHDLNFKFFYQLMTIDSETSSSTDIGFPKPEHDDRLDVVANAIRFLQRRIEIREVFQDKINQLTENAELGDLSAQAELGEIYRNGMGVEENYQEALKWYTKALNEYKEALSANKTTEQSEEEKNDFNNVLFGLGEMYRKGLGSDPNYKEAYKLYQELAYENVDARGYYGLAKLYEKHLIKDESIDINQKILGLYTDAARRGHTRAQFKLATIYQNGEAWGISVNPKKALGWYTEAASKGDREACFKLADMYYKGEGIQAANYEEAFKWYMTLAPQGEIKAQLKVAKMYRKGIGIKQDYIEALKWYTRALRRGNVKSQYNIAKIYQKGWSGHKDEDKALKYYEKAARQGLFNAQVEAGIIYQKRENYEKTIELYSKATENIDAVKNNKKFAHVQFNLGLLYEKQENYDKAFQYYEKVASQGYASANTKLGWMYQHGKGVEINMEKALEYYSKGVQF
ncbi:hypothetical protein Aasi_0951 [Candidatus Amoebophilus asiaticus 5a2]|uniref:Terminase large subunit ribonuclease H-like domain-containing protein n=1 Tax=Amoebophilus asiaticus (strain 5a2) TaxID=452471 RepID=B3ESV8_AMOA5|nr:tetratricopeptide repeat protein [Candidatus Amoebophilus asiaticus]ACE06310.1 hypothetical protein Aasi_0951 [Candidatus Amoebophilus asiaticus 5a2]